MTPDIANARVNELAARARMAFFDRLPPARRERIAAGEEPMPPIGRWAWQVRDARGRWTGMREE